MKKVKSNNDFFETDLSWLDDPEFGIEGESAVQKSSKNPNKQEGDKIEIAGKVASISYVPSPKMLEGWKETGRKMKGITKSESHKAAIRAAAALRRGKPNGRKGIPQSEIHKKRIGDANRGVSRQTVWEGRHHSEETKEKIRQYNLNRDPAPYNHSAEKKVEISNKISAGKKGKKRSPEMMAKMAEQRAMNFKTPIGVFRDRSKAEKAYLELGHSKQDFKKLYIHQPDKFYFTKEPLTDN